MTLRPTSRHSPYGIGDENGSAVKRGGRRWWLWGWGDVAAGREEGGSGADVAYASKPELGGRMLARVAAAGLPADRVPGEEFYGGSRQLRRWLEERRQSYVLTIASNDG